MIIEKKLDRIIELLEETVKELKRDKSADNSFLEENAYEFLASHPDAPSRFAPKHSLSKESVKKAMGPMTIEQFLEGSLAGLERILMQTNVGKGSIKDAKKLIKEEIKERT